MPQPRLVPVDDPARAALAGEGFDAVVVVAPAPAAIAPGPAGEALAALARVDEHAVDAVALIAVPAAAGGRVVASPTGPVARDHDDVRRFADAAIAGMRRARDAGARRPLVLAGGFPARDEFAAAAPVTALAAAGATWEPLEAREARGEDACEPIAEIGWAALDAGAPGAAGVAEWVDAVEAGRRLARDLCGTEPERMAPPRFAEHCVEALRDRPVEVSVIDAPAAIARDYPLLNAVARASLGVERHRPRVVRLEYAGEGPVERTVLIAGKGVTYDTGGADLKVGGAMAGMSRDKGGAAAAAGLVRAVAALRPRGLRVVAELGLVRNSIGADAFVTDEIVASHAGVRVRIGNTDAEGRLVLADLLSHLRGRALGEPDARVLSIATLTGHAARAIGPYTSAIDNGPARAAGVALDLAALGDAWGDPFDPQRLRPEDFEFVRPRSRADDLLSCNPAPSSVTTRGHQFPVAFLAVASGLDRHGRDSDAPLPYTHLDIAGSAVEGEGFQHGRPSARPVVALAAALAADRLPR